MVYSADLCLKGLTAGVPILVKVPCRPLHLELNAILRALPHLHISLPKEITACCDFRSQDPLLTVSSMVTLPIFQNLENTYQDPH